MTQWRAMTVQMFIGLSCLIPDAALTSEYAVCDELVILDRLPEQARRLREPGAPASVRETYLTDIGQVSSWLGDGASRVIPSENLVAIARDIGLHRRVLDLIDAGNTAAADALIGSQEVRRMDAWVGAQLRIHHCSAGLDATPAEPTSAAANPAKVPDETSGFNPGPAVGAAHRLQISAVMIGGFLALLLGLAAILAGAWYFVSRHKAPRFGCHIAGAMQGHLYCEATEIFDLSETGCKLRLHDGLDPKQPLTIFFGDWSISAKAVWSNRHFAGLRFDQSLTPDQLRDILDGLSLSADDNGPPVPSLPCHDDTCREICPRYKLMQEAKAGPSASPQR